MKISLRAGIEMASPKAEEYAAIYARRSIKLENHSLEAQVQLAKAKIQESNLFLYDIYQDKETATKYHPLHRPGFKRLMYDAVNGRFKTVVVFRRDRLARKVQDLLEIKNLFKKLGIKIIYSNYGEYQADDSYISNFIENIIMSVDELEPSILSERISSGKQEKRERGEFWAGGAYPPLGYKRDTRPDMTYYILDKPKNDTDIDKIKMIQEIFEKYNDINDTTYSLDMLVAEISKKFKTAKYNKKTLVDKIILNPLYANLLILNTDLHPSDTIFFNEDTCKYDINKSNYIQCVNVQKIITPELWYETLLKWKSLNPTIQSFSKEDENYPFKELLTCSNCKCKIILYDNYYRCKKCDLTINKEILQDKLLKHILNTLMTSTNLLKCKEEKLSDYDSTIKYYEEKLVKISMLQDKTLLNIISSYNDYCNSNENILCNKDLIENINKENEIKNTIDDIKQDAYKFNVLIEKLKEISEIKNFDILLNMLKKNIEAIHELLPEIIENIKIGSDIYPLLKDHKWKVHINGDLKGFIKYIK